MPEVANQNKSGFSLLIKGVLFIVAGTLIVLLARNFDARILDLKETNPYTLPLFYLAFASIAPLALLPGSIVTIAGGALFGPVMGLLLTCIGGTVGTLLPFLLARTIFREKLLFYLKSNKKSEARLKRLLSHSESHGWKYVAASRLSNIIPYIFANYAFGLTKIKTWSYIWATFVFLFPSRFIFTYIGYSGKEIALTDILPNQGTIIQIVLVIVAFAAMTLAFRRLARIKESD